MEKEFLWKKQGDAIIQCIKQRYETELGKQSNIQKRNNNSVEVVNTDKLLKLIRANNTNVYVPTKVIK